MLDIGRDASRLANILGSWVAALPSCDLILPRVKFYQIKKKGEGHESLRPF